MTAGLRVTVCVATLCAASATSMAQTTSARADSLDVTARADGLLESGKAQRAARLYRRAIEIDDTNERAYLGLSSALELRGHHLAALKLLDRAEASVGWTVDIGIQRGIHSLRLERWNDAAASLEHALKRRPKSFTAA